MSRDPSRGAAEARSGPTEAPGSVAPRSAMARASQVAFPLGMPAAPASPIVAFLTGPTAVGKSAVALGCAEERNWEIVSVDSRQVYRRLAVGTAKPSASDQARVRHHLLDLLEPTEAASAGWFRERFAGVAADLAAREVRGLAVGGTGLYWEACTRGLHELPAPVPALRAELEEVAAREGVAALHAQLAALDPAGARGVDPANRHRVIRALELVRLSGQPLASLYAGARAGAAPASGPPLAIVLLRPRGELHARIEARCRAMVEAGLLGEIRALLDAGTPADAPGLRTVGYREFLPHLLDGAPLEACMARFVVATRQYARRQETWFRHRLPRKVEVRLPEGTDDAEAGDEVRRVLVEAGLF